MFNFPWKLTDFLAVVSECMQYLVDGWRRKYFVYIHTRVKELVSMPFLFSVFIYLFILLFYLFCKFTSTAGLKKEIRQRKTQTHKKHGPKDKRIPSNQNKKNNNKNNKNKTKQNKNKGGLSIKRGTGKYLHLMTQTEIKKKMSP